MWRRGVVVLTAAQLHSSLNSDSAQVRTKLVACRKFAMMRISDNGPYWKKGLIVFCWSTTIPQKQFIIIRYHSPHPVQGNGQYQRAPISPLSGRYLL